MSPCAETPAPIEVTLPGRLRAWMERQVEQLGLPSLANYVELLVRQDRQQALFRELAKAQAEATAECAEEEA